MKNWCIILVLSAIMALPMTGCATLSNSGGWQNNVPQLKADIFMFSKLATRIALAEAQILSNDVNLISGYLVALRDLLVVPGQPNFTGARVMVIRELPQKYRIYGLTIIDVLERYLQTANLNITEDQELIVAIISSGIDGALEAVQEFVIR